VLRVYSTGEKGKIQVSAQTAALLVESGRNWTIPREEKVLAKGKGELQTFWLEISSGSDTMSYTEEGDELESMRNSSRKGETPDDVTSHTSSTLGVHSALPRTTELDQRYRLQVKWNVDVLQQRLQSILSERANRLEITTESHGDPAQTSTPSTIPLDEVKESLRLPRLDTPSIGLERVKPFILPKQVIEQLESFVTAVARLYPGHPFHNFEHASHVTMSVSKLLSRVQLRLPGKSLNAIQELVSHPMTQFACVFAAFVHDVSHSGVPNSVLLTENDQLAVKYHGKSIGEQHSFTVAWELLMQPGFKELRSCICSSQEELSLFRSILIQLIMATGIMDKDLGEGRKARWEKAFCVKHTKNNKSDLGSLVDLQGTAVLELLIQASDVAHTMQHWHVYRKWNERLFRELYQGFLDGRVDKDPSEIWYQGELMFFDQCIIPLAKKLAVCGVFGACSSEHLSYAEANRTEWEAKGENIVQEYLAYFGDYSSILIE
jgi:3'5'-cyclic nucleotide phosphodiesterase